MTVHGRTAAWDEVRAADQHGLADAVMCDLDCQGRAGDWRPSTTPSAEEELVPYSIGAQERWRTCPRCQATMDAAERLCPSCGYEMGGGVGAAVAQSVPAATGSSTPTDRRPTIHVKTYRGPSQELSAQAFAADSVAAATAGYDVLSQAWDGAALTVTYRLRQEPAAATAVPVMGTEPPRPSPIAQRPATVTGSGAGLQVGGLLVLGGGIAGVAGAFLPWVTASTGFASVSRGGMELGSADPYIVVILAVLVCLVGVSLAAGSDAAPPVAGLILGGLLAGLGVLEFSNMNGRIRELSDIVGSVGFGIYAIILGGLIACAGALVAANARPDKP